jgi:hypothetical protein
VQVRISRQRIQNGGGWSFGGSLYNSGIRTSVFSTSSSSAAHRKPTSGESSSDLPTPSAWPQSTPLVPDGPCISWFISPTPMIDPISVCELDDGNPKYQVARFHTIAAISSANTIAKPAPLPTCRISSTGSSCRMPNATAPLEIITPRKFHMPDQITATFGVSECV